MERTKRNKRAELKEREKGNKVIFLFVTSIFSKQICSAYLRHKTYFYLLFSKLYTKFSWTSPNWVAWIQKMVQLHYGVSQYYVVAYISTEYDILLSRFRFVIGFFFREPFLPVYMLIQRSWKLLFKRAAYDSEISDSLHLLLLSRVTPISTSSVLWLLRWHRKCNISNFLCGYASIAAFKQRAFCYTAFSNSFNSFVFSYMILWCTFEMLAWFSWCVW